MSRNRVAERTSRRRNKILAITSAGVVLAAGITVPSLAAWTDIEWIAGGAGTVAGVGTGTFEVQQFAANDADWGDYETQGSANVIDFSTQAASLTPGDTVYAYVRLRTVVNSLGGDLSLVSDTVVTPSTLSAALTYGARIVPNAAACTQAGFDAVTGADILVASASGLSADGATDFALAAGTSTLAGAEKVVCFALDFPASFANDTTVQNQTVIPIWHFDAVSVAP